MLKPSPLQYLASKFPFKISMNIYKVQYKDEQPHCKPKIRQDNIPESGVHFY